MKNISPLSERMRPKKTSLAHVIAKYVAISKAKKDVQETKNDPVPFHIRNAPTKLIKNLGYGKGYQYAHDSEDAFSGQDFLPENLQGSIYYEPKEFGFEREVKKRIEYWNKLKKSKR